MATRSRMPKMPRRAGWLGDVAEALGSSETTDPAPIVQPRRRWPLAVMAILTGMGGVLALAGLALSLNFLSLRVWVAYHAPFLVQPVTRARAPLSKPTAQAIEEGLSLLGFGLMAIGVIVLVGFLTQSRPGSRWLQAGRLVACLLCMITLVGLILLASASPLLDLPPEMLGAAAQLRLWLSQLVHRLI